MREINVVVTCSDRKKVPIAAALRLRNVSGATVEDRLDVWTSRLAAAGSIGARADAVYGGSHWSAVLGLPSELPSFGARVRTWICSAGYGLISPSTPIAGYGATFAYEAEDAVSNGEDFSTRVDETQRWWSGLSAWRGAGYGKPRSLTELATSNRQALMLVAASPAYLRAMAQDLLRARTVLRSAKQLSIISAGTGRLPGLQEHLLPVDGKLLPVVGGAMPSLNVRILRKILLEASRWHPRLPDLKRRYEALMKRQQPLEKFDRRPISDAEVVTFIEDALKQDPSTRHTPLLRRLRDSGRACEQSRFRQLFQQVSSHHYGTS